MHPYHEASKHTWESVRHESGGLDWDNQPDPYRTYAGSPVTALPRPVGRIDRPAGEVMDELGGARLALGGLPRELDLETIGTLLFHSVAVSATKEARESRGVVRRWRLRVNPSSGNLHPTETYLAIQGCPGLASGLHHYRVLDHALELRREGDAMRAILSAAGRVAPAGLSAVFVLTSIVWREAWKYRLRAYRYCLLDAGHAAACLALAARGLGIAAASLGWFADLEMAEALASSEGDEIPLVVVPIGTAEEIAALAGTQAFEKRSGAPARLGPPLGTPNRLSKDPWGYREIDEIHAATSLAAEAPLPSGPGPRVTGPIERFGGRATRVLRLPPPSKIVEPLGSLVRRRRSSLDHDRAARIGAAGAAAVLASGLLSQPSDWGFDLIRLYVYAHAVSGLSPGLYLAASGGAGTGGPRLALLREGDERDRARFLGLEQEVAGDGVIALALVADFVAAEWAFGPRGYRLAHFEAGARAQLVYLAAHAVGLGGTGMGAFYDDEVHADMALAPGDGQDVYHFAVGKPVPDPRIVEGPDPFTSPDG